MAVLANLARMNSSTTGTGSPMTLTTAVTSYLTLLQAGIVDGQVVTYAISDTPNREIGRGVVGSSGTTITRTAILRSTNSNNAISLTGNQQVFITPAAEDVMSGSVYPTFVAPISGDFAWANQGGASVAVNANGGVHLIAPANSGDSLRMRVKTAPATPYTITACFLMNLVQVVFQLGGLCWRQSSDGKVITVGLVKQVALADCTIACIDFTNETTFTAINGDVDCMAPPQPIWFRLVDNGTNRIASWSVDGYNFTQLFSEGRTTFLTADQVGFFVSTSTASWPASATMLSWRQE